MLKTQICVTRPQCVNGIQKSGRADSAVAVGFVTLSVRWVTWCLQVTTVDVMELEDQADG